MRAITPSRSVSSIHTLVAIVALCSGLLALQACHDYRDDTVQFSKTTSMLEYGG